MVLWKRSNFLSLVITLSISSTVTSDQNTSNHTDKQSRSNDFPEVTITQGKVKGLYLQTRNEREIFGFKGIPYAKPPVGNLRFKSPVPADPWNGIFDASHESNKCPQLQNQMSVGNEDCLYINVYTPKLPLGENHPFLSVMMFVHGGGFAQGSNDFNIHGPGYLLDEDIVLVVPNYRLGILGFLSTGDAESPGNYGLKDQVLALKWIRDNIKSFGGNPNQVTIVGQDAGSISVNYLAFSDSTKDLFHRYIAQSGPALGFAAYQSRIHAAENALKLSQHFGCPTNTSADSISCLRAVNASQIVDTVSLFHVWDIFPIIVWGPTDEPANEDAILTDNPAKLFTDGKLRDLPCITGVVKDEGLMISSYFYSNPHKFDHLLANMNDVLPQVLQYYHKIADVTAYTAAFKEFYLNDVTTERGMLMLNFTDLVGDGLMIFPTYEQLQRKISSGKNASYLYSFEYRGTLSYSDLQIKTLNDYGVSHTDELIYLFPRVESEFKSTGKVMSVTDLRMVKIMVDLWSSFVNIGIPSSPSISAKEPWEPYSSKNNYLRLGNGVVLALEVRESMNEARMKFWQKLTTTHGSIVFENNGTRSKDATDKARRTKRSIKNPMLQLPHGPIEGIMMTTFRKRNISAFLSIPYAQPPIGNLRFKSPVASNPWIGTLYATNANKICPQLFGSRVIGEEDCLYLNVYTPQIPTEESQLLPVMMYIHGGGFEKGDAGPSHFSPEYLLDEDVILVAPNYRLGVLGFLSTGDEVLPGNYGLKDMVLALKWVKNNIVYFGGDATQVTVFGQGAGAGATELLALSNKTNGLFHKYITESGSAFSIRNFRPSKSYISRATELGGYLKCPTDSSLSLLDCLNKLQSSVIVGTRFSFYKWDTFPDTVWGPTEEPDGEEAFITKNPSILYATAEIQDLPWITGVVQDEGLLLTSRFYRDSKLFDKFLKKIDKVLPHVLQYHKVCNDERAFTKALREYYLNDLSADKNVLLANFTRLVGDSMFTFPVYSGLRQRLRFANSKEYFYSFQYQGTFSFSFNYSGGSTKNYGVAHGDELLYLFPQLEPTLTELGKKMSVNDKRMVGTMVQLWTSFAVNGTPSSPKLKSFHRWRPHSNVDNYLRIGYKAKTIVRPHYFFLTDRMSFWKQFNDTMSNPPGLFSSVVSFVDNLLVWFENIASSLWHWIVFWT